MVGGRVLVMVGTLQDQHAEEGGEGEERWQGEFSETIHERHYWEGPRRVSRSPKGFNPEGRGVRMVPSSKEDP
jgi:hypothetical protein